MNIVFRECPQCSGYGVCDNGMNCKHCGGKGRGGLLGNDQMGSGEIMIDMDTGCQITSKELVTIKRRGK